MIDAYSQRTGPRTSPDQFLLLLNQLAVYAATRGSAFFLRRHAVFLIAYVDAWVNGRQQDPQSCTETLYLHTPAWFQRATARMLCSERVPRRARTFLTLAPLFFPLVVILPFQMIRSGTSSVLDVMRHGVRSAPPLLTAVVVVFVTGDAWRILGTGFTARFFALIGLFIVGGLFFLTRYHFWDDLRTSETEALVLLSGLKQRCAAASEFIKLGAQPTPVNRPVRSGAVYVRVIYLAVTVSALVTAALFVAVALILVGVTLIDARETSNLAGSVDVYLSVAGVVFTKQLLSLSLSLGAFASFFLVAAQRPEDREVFMNKILSRARRSLLAYTVYCQAHDHAAEWTGVPVRMSGRGQRGHEGG
jgi:hypothetical protein